MNIESDNFDSFVELNEAYRQKYPRSKEIANLVLSDVVCVDEAIEVLKEAKGREITFEVDYSISFEPVFKGFLYIEKPSA